MSSVTRMSEKMTPEEAFEEWFRSDDHHVDRKDAWLAGAAWAAEEAVVAAKNALGDDEEYLSTEVEAAICARFATKEE